VVMVKLFRDVRLLELLKSMSVKKILVLRKGDNQRLSSEAEKEERQMRVCEE
jgi:hypothetical protein